MTPENLRIWKVMLPHPGDLNYMTMPVGAEVVAANMQQGAMVAWVMVDHTAPRIDIPLHVVGTGWPIPEAMYGDDVVMRYKATICTPQGFVWHVLQGEVVPPEWDERDGVSPGAV